MLENVFMIIVAATLIAAVSITAHKCYGIYEEGILDLEERASDLLDEIEEIRSAEVNKDMEEQRDRARESMNFFASIVGEIEYILADALNIPENQGIDAKDIPSQVHVICRCRDAAIAQTKTVEGHLEKYKDLYETAKAEAEEQERMHAEACSAIDELIKQRDQANEKLAVFADELAKAYEELAVAKALANAKKPFPILSADMLDEIIQCLNVLTAKEPVPDMYQEALIQALRYFRDLQKVDEA